MGVIDGRQLLQLRLDISSEQGPLLERRGLSSDDRDSPMLILQFDFQWTGHPDHRISHAMIAVNHINYNLFNPVLGIT